MNLRDEDILDSVNDLAPGQRESLIEFIGVRQLDKADIDAILRAHEPSSEVPANRRN